MNYVLKNATAKQVPYTNRDGVYGIDVIIFTGIQGQTYDGFQNVDQGFCPVEKTDTIDTVQEKITTFATAFIAEKYPNT